MVYIDPSGKISRINTAMERILGRKKEEVLGSPLSKILGEAELCHLVTGRDGFSMYGSQYEVESIELKDANCSGLGLVAVFRDVTEIQRFERERADFLSMLTHDLKSPLTTILGYSVLIREGGMGAVTPEVKEAVEAIERSGRKLMGLIEDFLTLSRYDTGMQPITPVPLRLEDLVSPLIDVYSAEAARNEKTLAYLAEPGLPPIMGDLKQLERLVTNLLDNAFKFTGRGGRISVEIRTAADAIELKVIDNGIGIPAEEIPHLFDRYWRGSKSRGMRGSGLGLAIVKCVARMHDGSVSVKSEEGKGSEFCIKIPARK